MAKRYKKTCDLWGDLRYDSCLNRSKFALTVENDQYVILAGGYGAHSLSVIVFDIKNSTAIHLPNLPTEDYHGSCVGTILDRNLYLISRYGECPIYRLNLNDLNELKNKTSEQVWEKVDGSKKHYGETVVPNQNNLFLFSDHGNEAYIPQTNMWIPLPYMSNPRWDHASAIYKNKVYVIGGYDDIKSFPTKSVEVYDIMKRKWSPTTNLPMYLYGSAAAIVADRFIIVTGGVNEKEERVKDCFVLDIEREEWFNASPVRLLSPRSNHGCVVDRKGTRLMIVGGLSMKGDTQQNIPYNECLKIPEILNWYILKHVLLLRHLVGEGRASIRTSADLAKEHLIIQKTIESMELDPFRNILSFLIISK